MIFLLRLVVFLLGLGLVLGTLSAALRTFVVPRGEDVKLTRWVFRAVRLLFRLPLRFARTYESQDRLLALYAPTALLITPMVWLTQILIGYIGMFWAVGVQSVDQAFFVSGSSLLTLGFASVSGLPQIILAFTEAMIGLGFAALLIAYLPTIYGAFSRRESSVALLEAYAGSPPSAFELVARFDRIRGLEYLGELWANWELWFAELEESHTSLAALAFFRSPTSNRHWVTAAGTVLDAASLAASSLDIPPDPRANLCIRAGFLALRRIADYFYIEYDPSPRPDDPISIREEEYQAGLERLAKSGVPVKADRGAAWVDYAGWRVNYDKVLLALAQMTQAPVAPWTSDRPPVT